MYFAFILSERITIASSKKVLKGHTLSNGLGPAPSEKVDHGPLEKADPIPKFTV